MFALFEDDLTSSMGLQASQPSAAQPAVMDIRSLRRRLLEIHRLIALTSSKVERGAACLRFSNWGFVQSFSLFFLIIFVLGDRQIEKEVLPLWLKRHFNNKDTLIILKEKL